MALYWPQQHIALDVVDDPCSAPVDRDAFPGVTVVRVTCDQIAHPLSSPRRGDAGGALPRQVQQLLVHGGLAAAGGTA